MVKNLMSKFVKEQEGGIAEYVIILGIVAMIAIFLGPKLKSMFDNYSQCMNNQSTTALSSVTNTTATSSSC